MTKKTAPKKPKSSNKSPKNIKTQLAEAQEQVLRYAAELENLRRRHSQEIVKAHKYAAAELAKEILPIADNLERALKAMGEPAFSTHKQGIEAISKQFADALNKAGVRQIAIQKGQDFDPSVHQAIGNEPNFAKNKVAEVVANGYMIADRLLRPSMVMVGTKEKA